MKTPLYRMLVAIAAVVPSMFPMSGRVASAAPPEPAKRQPEVVVTAGRHAQNADAVLASVTVLTRGDIEASQASDLIDLLARQAGIDVSRNGGPGQVSTLFLRGANSNQTLILIDGVRVNSAGQGLFDLAHLPPEQIERIEIVRGPRAALWGSDAIGGVVHIFTRDPRGAQASLRGGRWGRAEAAAGLGLEGERGRFGVQAGYRRLRGFSATDPSAFGHDPDDDGYRQRHVALRGEWALADHALDISAFGSDADVEFDQGRSDVDSVSGGIGLTGPLATSWRHRLAYGHARENLDTPVFDNRFESRRHSFDWLHTLDMLPATVNFGVNWQRETGRTLSEFAGALIDRDRRNLAGFVSGTGRYGHFEWQAALRHDDNSRFGGASTGNLALGYRFDPALRVRASWGQGFRAPNFNELFSPGFGGLFAGNPDLGPERSRSVEAGAELDLGGQRLAISAFDTRVRDQVAFSGPLFGAVNIARARVRGVEFEQHWRLQRLSGRNAITLQNAEDRDTGQRLLRRPDRKLASSLDWRVHDAFDLGLDLQWLSARRDFDGTLGGHALVHLRGEWRLSPTWRAQARLENLADRDYRLASGFATPGRNLALALLWRP